MAEVLRGKLDDVGENPCVKPVVAEALYFHSFFLFLIFRYDVITIFRYFEGSLFRDFDITILRGFKAL